MASCSATHTTKGPAYDRVYRAIVLPAATITEIASENLDRRWLFIQNQTAAVAYIGVSAARCVHMLAAGNAGAAESSVEMSVANGNLTRQAIYGLSNGGGTFVVGEAPAASIPGEVAAGESSSSSTLSSQSTPSASSKSTASSPSSQSTPSASSQSTASTASTPSASSQSTPSASSASTPSASSASSPSTDSTDSSSVEESSASSPSTVSTSSYSSVTGTSSASTASSDSSGP